MKRLLFLMLLASATAAAADSPEAWPEATQMSKPWTRWWWPGNAVDRESLSAQLRALADAGIGGVEITPIYGARGAEPREVEYLSPRWVELLAFTSAEAKRLGLGVDMATGTGWPFGGPEVSAAQGSSTMVLVEGRVTGKPTGMKVKRAAPGGAGLVLDPYSTEALDAYLARFTRAFEALPAGSLRAQFHDSFEYYNAGWSPALPQTFLALNGYDIQSQARELMGAVPVDADALGRLKGDYRRTLSRMHLDYVREWVKWSHDHGFTAREQAHGAPGNLLDLYAAADIPETESYGMTPLPIPGLRAEADSVNPDPDPATNLIARFASSAAHVAGRPLASSETLTWLRENFREAPWAAKPQIDRLFAAGINHIFYHGLSYTPGDAPWPGWYFYAATQLNPNNPLWQDYAAMHAYVGRVQSILQANAPDNDVLVYWPFDELVDDAQGLMRQYGVHENQWLTESAAGKLAMRLLEAGYSFDFISDAQIAGLPELRARYRVLLVPQVHRVSPDTMMSLDRWAKRGVPVLFESLPDDVPGFGNLESRRAQLRQLLADPAWAARVVGPDVPGALARLGIVAEGAGAAKLAYTRRTRAHGHDYFFANLGADAFDGWLPLATPAQSATLMDPLSGRSGAAALRTEVVRTAIAKPASVYLQLASGQSMILRTYTEPPASPGGSAWLYVARTGDGYVIPGEWQVEFRRGGPALPGPLRMQSLRSWTEFDDPKLASFSGTARYRVTFDAPAKAAAWRLDLGDVREAARVTLNGQPIGNAWSLPFQLQLPGRLKPKGNVLEIDVTNLPANRIRDLDLRKVDWKVMKEINLVDLRYKPFDASGWPVAPSGLLGPVRLVPLKVVSPR